jgi:chemotaxis protein methyltransferase CheR
MQQLGLVLEDEYFDRLRGAAPSIVEAELRNLLNLVTITETCFFRDASQFRLLREHIIPTLMSERSTRTNKTIRLWSAGCSTGEEAYSIAITLDAMGMFQALPEWSIEIIATDLNTSALEKARSGVYTERALRNVEGRLLDDYFVRDGKTFALSDAIKSRVTFEFGNLMQTPMPSTGAQDIVFCKNVAIYFRPDLTRKLLEGLYGTLAPDGYLLLGHAESLWQVSDDFALVEHARAFCYRKSSHVERQRETFTRVVPGFRPARARSAIPAGRHVSRGSEDYDVCLAAFRAGQWDVAESLLSALVVSYPTFVPGLILLGGVYVHRGRFDDAVGLAGRVLKVSDLEPRAHLLLGMIAARRQRHDDALQSLRRALYLDDSLALGHFWLGNLYRGRGDIARACREYENVVRDWEHDTLQLTEEFASDLSAEQLVGFCRDTLERLRLGSRQSVVGSR